MMLIEDDESIRRGAIDWDAGEDDDSFRFVHSTIWFFRDDNHYQPLATISAHNTYTQTRETGERRESTTRSMAHSI